VGYNNVGGLGLGHMARVYRPARAPDGPRPAAVTGGTDHVIVTFANAENGQ
jgi:hypothetical protein